MPIQTANNIRTRKKGVSMQNVQKVWFFIHRLSAEKIFKISKRLFKKYPFVKPTIEDNKCILLCYDIGGSAASWLIQKAVDCKKFRGRFDPLSPLYDQNNESKTVYRYFVAACRFGYFDFWDYPLDDFSSFVHLRFIYQYHYRMPLFKASKLASCEAKYALHSSPEVSLIKRKEYIQDLVNFFGKTNKQAERIVFKTFPELKDIKVEKKVLTQEEEKIRNQKMNMKIHDLIGKLAFMSPKMRKRYLDEGDNIGEFLLFIVIVKTKGVDWVKEKIGLIPGIID